jgi:hypothetical protein
MLVSVSLAHAIELIFHWVPRRTNVHAINPVSLAGFP